MVALRNKTKSRVVVLKLDRWLILVTVLAVCLIPTFLLFSKYCKNLASLTEPTTAIPLLASSLASSITTPTDNAGGPQLVVHVGPPKTGTTSLQYMLRQLDPQLRQDGYHYLFNVTSEANSFKCQRRLKQDPASAGCWFDFHNTVQEYRKQGKNVLLSDEVISLKAGDSDYGYFERLRQVIDPWLPNVLIVVGYRHLHNFFPSTHFELQRNQRWPSERERGKFITPIIKFWTDNAATVRQQVGPVSTPAAVAKQWRNSYSNISLLNIENTEQVEEFVCHILPHAPATCAYHKENPPEALPELNKNDGGQINYDALAILAWQGGYFKKDQTRKYVRNKIGGLVKKDKIKFPLNCFSKGLQDLMLKESILHAREAGVDVNEVVEKEMEQNFRKAVDKLKYCTINAEQALEQDVWKNYLAEAKTTW